MMPAKILITGMGAVSACGNDLTQILESFSLGKRNVGPVSLFTSDLTYPVFEVKNIPRRFIRHKRRTLSLLLCALEQALTEADLIEIPSNLRVGVCFGTTVASQLNDIDFYEDYRTVRRVGMEAVDRYLGNNLSQNIVKLINAHGPFCTVVNACSSGADSIGVALAWLRSDLCDLVICGGADELSRVPYCGFGSLGIVSESLCAPFDRDREGLNLGEGAGVLVLEKEEIALKRKKTSSLFLAGYGSAADSYHLTAPHPQGIGLEFALNSALNDAGITAGEVCFVNAHGTATRENDKVEGMILGKVFGEDLKFLSTKGFTGHTLGAAGALEAIFIALGLKEGWIPQSVGFNTLDEEIALSPLISKTEIEGSYAVSTSLAFGGNNTAIVIGRQ